MGVNVCQQGKSLQLQVLADIHSRCCQYRYLEAEPATNIDILIISMIPSRHPCESVSWDTGAGSQSAIMDFAAVNLGWLLLDRRLIGDLSVS